MNSDHDEQQLNRLLDVAEMHARRILISFGADELTPLFHLVCPGTHDYCIATPFSGDESKDAAAQMVREKIRETGATAYMFLSEAWMITREPGYDLQRSQRPTDAPDRIEVVIAIATDGVGYKARRWRIKRGHRGQCVDLMLDSDSLEMRHGGGRFDNLFTRH